MIKGLGFRIGRLGFRGFKGPMTTYSYIVLPDSKHHQAFGCHKIHVRVPKKLMVVALLMRLYAQARRTNNVL